MKKLILLLLWPALATCLFAQNKEEAAKLIEEGIAYHDKGDYAGAIVRYDKALAADKDNLVAMTEKALTLLSLERYDDAVEICRHAIEKYPEDENLKSVYVTYANAYDGLKQTDKSIEIYDEGLKKFPRFYQLHYNKGIALSSVRKYDEALLCFEKAVTLNPKHASSHNGIARMCDVKDKPIPSLMAYCRFLALEPQSKRAKLNLENVEKLVKGNVKKTGKNAITISIDPNVLDDTAKDGKRNENGFGPVALLLAMDAALDFDKKNKNKTEVEQFIRKFESVCSILKETQKDGHGFYWDYYVPYFVEMNDKKLIEPFAYVAFASSEYPDVSKWLKSHKEDIEKFLDWSKSFSWKTN